MKDYYNWIEDENGVLEEIPEDEDLISNSTKVGKKKLSQK